jgi:hypothetical protein
MHFLVRSGLRVNIRARGCVMRHVGLFRRAIQRVPRVHVDRREFGSAYEKATLMDMTLRDLRSLLALVVGMLLVLAA